MKHGIEIIQVELSICDKCDQTFVLKSNFGSHIQSSHVWTDHKKPAVLVHFLFIMEQDEEVIAEAVNLCTMMLLLKSVQMITPPPSLQTFLPATTLLFTLMERRVFYLLLAWEPAIYDNFCPAVLATQAPLEVRYHYICLRLSFFY